MSGLYDLQLIQILSNIIYYSDFYELYIHKKIKINSSSSVDKPSHMLSDEAESAKTLCWKC